MIRNLFWNKLDCFFCSTLQTLYLGFYCLWMVPMLLPVKKWLQLCPVQKLLLIKGFKNALKLWWQRSVLGEIHLTSRLEQVAYSPAYLSSSIICVALACWFFAFYVFFFFFSLFYSLLLFLSHCFLFSCLNLLPLFQHHLFGALMIFILMLRYFVLVKLLCRWSGYYQLNRRQQIIGCLMMELLLIIGQQMPALGTSKLTNLEPEVWINISKFIGDSWRPDERIPFLFFLFFLWVIFCPHGDLNLECPTSPPQPLTTWTRPQVVPFYFSEHLKQLNFVLRAFKMRLSHLKILRTVFVLFSVYFYLETAPFYMKNLQ